MAWITGTEDPNKVVIDTKEREIIKVGFRGKIKERQLITETYRDDGQILDQRTHIIQSHIPGRLAKFLKKLPLIKNAKSIKVTEKKNEVIIQTSDGEVINEKV